MRAGKRGVHTDERGVSPVIGVVLMVAVTVILAAVIGTYVTGIGAGIGEQPPSATFTGQFTDVDVTTTSEDDSVNISYETGDSIPAASLTVYVSGFSLDGGSTLTERHTLIDGVTWSSSPLSAGSTLAIDDETDLEDPDGIHIQKNVNCGGCTDTDLNLNGATIQIVWSASDDDKTSILYEWTVPKN